MKQPVRIELTNDSLFLEGLLGVTIFVVENRP